MNNSVREHRVPAVALFGSPLQLYGWVVEVPLASLARQLRRSIRLRVGRKRINKIIATWIGHAHHTCLY